MIDIFKNICLDNFVIAKERNKLGIVEGSSGLILCYAYLYILTKQNLFKDKLDILLDILSNNNYDNLSLGSGFGGGAWTISLIDKIGLIEDSDDWFVDVNELLSREFLFQIEQCNFDYFTGASGLLFYFINSKTNLHEENDKINIFINSVKKSISVNQKSKNCKRANINLGVPHGISGLILILLIVREKTLCKVDEIILDLIELLLSYRKSNNFYHFPSVIIDGEIRYSGIAWCYGDLSVSYAILKAGIILNNNLYKEIALGILYATLTRKDFRFENLSLCHGYTSVSIIYDQIHKLTGDMVFRDISIRMQKDSIKIFRHHYNEYMCSYSFSDYFRNASVFLGFPGFILSYLSWNKLIDNNWTKCLLL